MTLPELQLILALQPSEIISKLQKSSFSIPSWSDLEKQYDPEKHSINDTSKYPPKLNDNGHDDFKRIKFALQKLAVDRISQAMFSEPVQRLYDYDVDSESQTKAKDILEQIYRTENYIDSENIERAKKLNASCQFVTVWKGLEKENLIKGELTKLKLSHSTYSEMDGYKIYAHVDENGDLIVVLIQYTDDNSKEHAYVFTNEEKPFLRVYDNISGWTLNKEKSGELPIFPVTYMNLKSPVWGGDAGTTLVETMEEMASYQSLYIKRNSKPQFTLDIGEITGARKATEEEKSNDVRSIIMVGKGGNMQAVNWPGATDAIDKEYHKLRDAFFEMVQMPDTSFANLSKSNMSADNREFLFGDSKAKARDLGGEWEKMFYQELNIVKEFAKTMFPKYRTEFDLISVRSIIKPYSIKTKKENGEYVAMAGNAMSMATKVRILDEVDNVQQEVDAIADETNASNNL